MEEGGRSSESGECYTGYSRERREGGRQSQVSVILDVVERGGREVVRVR